MEIDIRSFTYAKISNCRAAAHRQRRLTGDGTHQRQGSSVSSRVARKPLEVRAESRASADPVRPAQFPICPPEIRPRNPVTSSLVISYSTSPELPYLVPWTVWQIVGQIVRETIRDAVLETARQTVRSTIRQTVRKTVEKTISRRIWRTVLTTVWRTIQPTIPKIARRIIGRTIWRAIRQTICLTIQQIV